MGPGANQEGGFAFIPNDEYVAVINDGFNLQGSHGAATPDHSALSDHCEISLRLGTCPCANGKVGRGLSKPKHCAWNQLKNVGRYLSRYQTWPSKVDYLAISRRSRVVLDEDWAGDDATRQKSKSSGVQYFGSHVVATWADVRHVITISSCEGELHVIGLGAAGALKFIGGSSLWARSSPTVNVQSDSAAATATGITLARSILVGSKLRQE